MKYVKNLALLLILFSFIVSTVKAEETLFNSDLDHDWMVAPYFTVGNLAGETAFMHGYRVQWLVNNRIGLGIGKLHANNKVDAMYSGKDYQMELHQSFLDVEYIINPDDLIHYSIYSAVGHGTLHAWEKDGENKFKDDIFFVQPGVNAEINITDWFKVNSGFGWRFCDDAEIDNRNIDNIDGWTAQIQLKFGWF